MIADSIVRAPRRYVIDTMGAGAGFMRSAVAGRLRQSRSSD